MDKGVRLRESLIWLFHSAKSLRQRADRCLAEVVEWKAEVNVPDWQRAVGTMSAVIDPLLPIPNPDSRIPAFQPIPNPESPIPSPQAAATHPPRISTGLRKPLRWWVPVAMSLR